MKKHISFLVVILSSMYTFTKAQDITIQNTSIDTANGGWNCIFTYNVDNPSTAVGNTTGLSCTSLKVTKISTPKTWYSGSFGLENLPTISDWTKYDKIELLIYPTHPINFNDSIIYHGNHNKTDIEVDVAGAVGTSKLVANEWNKVTINITKTLKNKANSSITYTSLGDTTLNLNAIQFYYFHIDNETTDMYIGDITLKEKSATEVAPTILNTSVDTAQSGWNCTYIYNVTNPDNSIGSTTGLRCTDVTVTKITTPNSWYRGAFGLERLSSITDWKKYSKLELLVYPTYSITFDDSIVYHGRYNNADIEVDVATAVGTSKLIANQWNRVSIDLTKPLVNKANSALTYTSLSDLTLNLSAIQFNYFQIENATCDIYVGGITLVDTSSTGVSVITNDKFIISPNPASSSITISNEGIENAKIVISTVTGIDVLSTKTVSDKTTIDVSSLSAGIYIVSIVTPQGTQSQKLIIK